MSFQVFAYRRSYNLGDAIQTVAISRLLSGELRAIFRDQGNTADSAMPFVVNGWLSGPVPRDPKNTIFAGVFVGARLKEQLEWMRGSTGPIGARDPFTVELLRKHGLEVAMLGCATLTFERFNGLRGGRYAVDIDRPEPDLHPLTNHIEAGNPWHEQWAMAMARIETLRRAELVVTSRLHVALPCLAFGTPVIVKRHQRTALSQPERFSLLDELGIPCDEVVVADVTDAAQRYNQWLGRMLNVEISPHEPIYPIPA
jgi:hypothetical protein